MASNSREENMKALIDAVAQVSGGGGGPTIPFPVPPLQAFHGALTHPATLSLKDSQMVQASQGGPLRKRNHGNVATLSKNDASITGAKRAKSSPSSFTTPEDASKRMKRLEQNRTAAIESRRRKKHMVEELQRSVHYFSRANSALKSQNSELERQLLLAKHKIVSNESVDQDTTTSPTKGKFAAASSLNSNTKMKAPSKKTNEIVVGLNPTNVAPSAGAGVSIFTNAPTNKSMAEQAQLAQFAATQALYKSMGYPTGAARTAASTFSQLVGQTGISPGLSATASESVRPSSSIQRNSSTMPSQATYAPLNVIDTKSPRLESNGDAYIEALNQFAMQQAAAANAAAAAATAAIQAVNIHNQLKQSGSVLSSSSVPSFPFPQPTDMSTWPFQSACSFPKID